MTTWAIGIDIGGTFTDVVALDYTTGKLHSLKVLTTHGDPAEGVAGGVGQLMAHSAGSIRGGYSGLCTPPRCSPMP